jgi:hypothetical protein
MSKGNKGEWSEVYSLLKIISDRNLYAGDKDLNKIDNLIFPIIKILRIESKGTFEFSYERDLVIVVDSIDRFEIPITIFKEKALFLLKKISAPNEGSFSVPEIESFINSFNNFSIKAKSNTKSDISVVVHDYRTGTTPELGFSIKSQIGGASTLLNAGKTTNFIYKINNVKFTDEEIKEINSIDSRSKIRDRIQKIREKQGKFEFLKTEKEIFGNNLILIDSSLPVIISNILLYYYSSDKSKVIDLVDELVGNNPIKYNLEFGHPFYLYKIKKFLVDIALGMMPSKTWTGHFESNGGYLVVKEDGEILCYHIYNLNNFEDYLLNNTKLDTASSSRHDFGYVYKKEANYYFNLNLQIRFLK